MDLINSIKERNPSYSTAVKEKKLTEVENDLIAGISAFITEIQKKSFSAMNAVKTVSLPFSYNKYGYLQLLAAYDKDTRVIRL